MIENEEFDPCVVYNNTKKLYKDIEAFMIKNNVKECSPPVVAVWVNDCVRHFCNPKGLKKRREKVIFLCIYYLDKVGYKL